MPRYIDAELAVKLLHSDFDMQELYLPIHFEEFIIDGVPSADVAPVVHAHWIDADQFDPFYLHGMCSNCRYEQSISDSLRYCPNCGARMDEKEDEPHGTDIQ